MWGKQKGPRFVREPWVCVWRAILHPRAEPRTPDGKPVVAVAAVAGARVNDRDIPHQPDVEVVRFEVADGDGPPKRNSKMRVVSFKSLVAVAEERVRTWT